MKKGIILVLYSIFAALALAGLAAAVLLFPTHAANGTSVGYFTMALFPTAFLLFGLAGLFFRYWPFLVGAAWLVLGGYLLGTEGWDPAWFLLLAVYLLLSLAAGLSGTALRKMRKTA